MATRAKVNNLLSLTVEPVEVKEYLVDTINLINCTCNASLMLVTGKIRNTSELRLD